MNGHKGQMSDAKQNVTPDSLMDEMRKLIRQIETHEKRGEAVPQLKRAAAKLYRRLKYVDHQGKLNPKEAKRWAAVQADSKISAYFEIT